MKEAITLVTEAGEYSFYASNLEQCLKGSSQLRGILYQNICDGTSYFVPAGFWDYALGFVLLAFGVCIIIAILKMILDY